MATHISQINRSVIQYLASDPHFHIITAIHAHPMPLHVSELKCLLNSETEEEIKQAVSELETAGIIRPIPFEDVAPRYALNPWIPKIIEDIAKALEKMEERKSRLSEMHHYKSMRLLPAAKEARS